MQHVNNAGSDDSPAFLDGVVHVFVCVVGKKSLYSMLGLSAPETGRVRPATGLQEYTGVVACYRLCRYRPVTGCIRRSPAAFCKPCHACRLPLCRYHPLAVRDQAQVALVVSQPSVAYCIVVSQHAPRHVHPYCRRLSHWGTSPFRLSLRFVLSRQATTVPVVATICSRAGADDLHRNNLNDWVAQWDRLHAYPVQ